MHRVIVVGVLGIKMSLFKVFLCLLHVCLFWAMVMCEKNSFTVLLHIAFSWRNWVPANLKKK